MTGTVRTSRFSGWAERISICAALLAIVAFLVYIVVVNVIQRGQIIGLSEDLAASQTNAQTLYEQLIDQGQPIAGEDPAEVVTGAQGIPGAPGARGSTGQDGERGADGEPGTPGADGAPGIQGPPGPAGANGANGADGLNGANGLDGAPGSPGASGADGSSGTPGPQGEQGPAGPAGPTCPEGYTVSITYVMASDDPLGIPTLQQAALCRPTPTEGATE